MQRPEVYDRHAAVPFQKELEEAARSREMSVDALLEQIVREWLERAARHEAESEEDLQQRIRTAAAPFIGAIHGGGGARSENVGSEVRARLARKYGR
jgi:predicted DNA-binding ribbon-helix-helix protein